MKTVACIVGPSLGCLLLCGGQPPFWLLKGEGLIAACFLLVYGFTA